MMSTCNNMINLFGYSILFGPSLFWYLLMCTLLTMKETFWHLTVNNYWIINTSYESPRTTEWPPVLHPWSGVHHLATSSRATRNQQNSIWGKARPTTSRRESRSRCDRAVGPSLWCRPRCPARRCRCCCRGRRRPLGYLPVRSRRNRFASEKARAPERLARRQRCRSEIRIHLSRLNSSFVKYSLMRITWNNCFC